ncbi:hypothetical protein DFH09DRAFT_1361687 [Mycena vulgaris]|nr:hypothetical protein DFH09DRAFT_1361687 [Mycena vulgaris]
MSTVATLQNAFDLPSPVTLHFDDPDFALTCPHSPTSSLKGVFVRSRPNSMDISDPTELMSEFAQFGMTGNTHVPVMQTPPSSKSPSYPAIPHPTRDTPSRDDCTVRTTATAATTPIRAVRRVVNEDPEDVPPTQPDASALSIRRRTWPSMERLRSSVSGIFQRTPKRYTSLAPPPPSPTDPTSDSETEITHVTPTPHARRTFSLSFRSRARTSSISSTKFPAPVGNIPTRTRRVRRSRSFSGFTSMAQQLGTIAEPDADADAELDEVGLEAYNTVRGIGRFWVYEEDEGESDLSPAAGLLERGVECS